MRVKEWFIKNLRTIAMFLGILLAISIIGVVALRFFRNAKLAVIATPLDATIKINGAKYHNGNHKFFAGKVTVEIIRDGFDTQKYEVELKSGQTATVYAALSQSGDYKTSRGLRSAKTYRHERVKRLHPRNRKLQTNHFSFATTPSHNAYKWQ